MTNPHPQHKHICILILLFEIREIEKNIMIKKSVYMQKKKDIERSSFNVGSVNTKKNENIKFLHAICQPAHP